MILHVNQSLMISIPCFRNLEYDFEGSTLGSINLAAQLIVSLPYFFGGNFAPSLGLGMLHQLPTIFVLILSSLFSFLSLASCPRFSQNSFLISVSKFSTLIFSAECPFLAVLSGLGQKYLCMEQISLLFSSTLNCWSARGLIRLLMMPIQFLFSPRYLMLQVLRMIYQTRMARSLRERVVYLETSMSSCYSCFRMRSLVSSDLLRAERIQKWEMFLWKRVLVEDAFFMVIEESNIIIPPLISLGAYPQKPEDDCPSRGCFSAWVFIIYNYKAMSTEEYMNHQVNASKTKQAHQFSKANRFPKSSKITTEVIYTLPSPSSKRTTTFGYGSKIDLANKTSSPPPGSYNAYSDFEKRDLHNTTSIHEGREKVTFGSFILEALKRNKEVPSPDKYNIPNIHKPIGGRMGQRIKTDFSDKEKKSIPGPGTYKLTAIQIGNKGSYVLSTLKNTSSPRYYSGFSLDKSRFKNKQPLPQATYDIEEKEYGRYPVSKFKSVVTCSFSKSERPSLADKTKKEFPGFKYRRFSQFGN